MIMTNNQDDNSQDTIYCDEPLLIDGYWTKTPTLLLQHYAEWGFSDGEMIFLQLLMLRAWHYKNEVFPLYKTLAKEMGKSKQRVMEYAKRLSDRTWIEKGKEYRGKGLIKIIPCKTENGSYTSNRFDISPFKNFLREQIIKAEKEKEGGGVENDTTLVSEMTLPSVGNDTTPFSESQSRTEQTSQKKMPSRSCLNRSNISSHASQPNEKEKELLEYASSILPNYTNCYQITLTTLRAIEESYPEVDIKFLIAEMAAHYSAQSKTQIYNWNKLLPKWVKNEVQWRKNKGGNGENKRSELYDPSTDVTLQRLLEESKGDEINV